MKLEVNNLSMVYPDGTRALDGVSFTLESGMHGLLGANGAGKSTLMRIISTLQSPTDGSVCLNGKLQSDDLQYFRSSIGYLPQEFGFYPKISAFELLNHLAILKGLSSKTERNERVKELLEKVNLYEHRHRELKGFSGGMKQRFGIAQALLTTPGLVIVDEPTAGLDPAERNRFHNLLLEYSKEAIVILSTHIVGDVTNMCDNVLAIDKGKLLYEGSPERAIETISGKIWEIDEIGFSSLSAPVRVISERLFKGKRITTVVSLQKPCDSAIAVEPTLEHFYFHLLKRQL